MAVGGITIATGFNVGAPVAIDTRFVLTKAEMVAVSDNVMPEMYLCLCSDDGLLYIYDKNNELNNETGKYRVQKSGIDEGMSGELVEFEDGLYEAKFNNVKSDIGG